MDDFWENHYIKGHLHNTGWWLGTCFISPYNIGNVIMPIDELIFFRGVGQPPTRYVWVFRIAHVPTPALNYSSLIHGEGLELLQK